MSFYLGCIAGAVCAIVVTRTGSLSYGALIVVGFGLLDLGLRGLYRGKSEEQSE